jgi:hypothetical protein
MNMVTRSLALAALTVTCCALTPQLSNAQSTNAMGDCAVNGSTNGCPPANGANLPPQPLVRAKPHSPPAINSNRLPQQRDVKHSSQPPQGDVKHLSRPPLGDVRNSPFPNQSGVWQYDPRQHRRHTHRDTVLRFSYGGFFYDQPYWQQYPGQMQSNRMSCNQGRIIVGRNGYNRVRVIECNGTTFTYQAQRSGHNYRIIFDSSRGTISSTYRLY